MPTGQIKKIMDKGFGFIALEGSDDIFFHMSSYAGSFDSLTEGQQVQFDLEDGPKGKKAVNVTLVDAAV